MKQNSMVRTCSALLVAGASTAKIARTPRKWGTYCWPLAAPPRRYCPRLPTPFLRLKETCRNSISHVDQTLANKFRHENVGAIEYTQNELELTNASLNERKTTQFTLRRWRRSTATQKYLASRGRSVCEQSD